MPATLLKSNNAELGLADLTTVTAGNSGGGSQDAFGAVNLGSGNTFRVNATAPLSGTFSFELTQAAANLLEIYWYLAATQADFAYQCEFIHRTPAANTAWFRTLNSLTGTGTILTTFMRTDNRIHIVDTAQLSTSSGSTLTAGTTYVFQYWQTTTTVNVNIYVKGSTTATISYAPTLTAANLPLAATGSCRAGIGTASTGITSQKLDNMKMGTGGFLARTDVTNAAPTSSVGPTQYVVAGTVINLVGSDADSDGTIVSRAWTWDTTDTSGPAGTTRKWAAGPTISGNTTANATATMATPGAFRAKYVVTDDVGATSTDVWTQVFVCPASNADAGVRFGLLGTFVTFGTGADVAVRLNDGSDATGVNSPDDPSSAPLVLLMNPQGPGNSTGAIKLMAKGNYTGAAGISEVCEWYKADGTTLVDSQTGTPGASLGEVTYTMSPTGLAAIPLQSDRAELVVKLKDTAV